MWATFKSSMSHCLSMAFSLVLGTLLRQTDKECRINDDNVLHAIQLLSRSLKEARAETPSSQVTDGRALCPQLSHENRDLREKRQANDSMSDLRNALELIKTVSLSNHDHIPAGTSIITHSTHVADASSVQPSVTSSDKPTAETTNPSPSEETSTTADFTSSQNPTTPSVTLTGSSSAAASETSSTRGGPSETSITRSITTDSTVTSSTRTEGISSTSESSTSSGTSRAEAPGAVSSTLSPPSSEMSSVSSSSTTTSSTGRFTSSTITTFSSTTTTTSSSAIFSSPSFSTTQWTSSTSRSATQSTPIRISSRTTSSSPSTIAQSSSAAATTLSSVSVIFPPSSTFTTKYISSRPRPFTVALPVTTTVIIFTTAPRHSTMTVETGALRTGISNATGFSQDTGAIVGVSIAAFVTLLSLLFLIFFACRRYRRRRGKSVYVDGLRRLARDFSYRNPVDGDEEQFAEKAPSRYPVSSHGHSADGMNDGALPADPSSQGHSSSESATATMVPMGTVFGGQAYMSGSFDQAQGLQRHVTGSDVHSEAGLLSRSQTARSTEAWRVPAGLYPYPYANNAARRSAASLFLPAASSNGHTTLSSSAEDGLYKTRKTSSGVTHESGKPARRHHSTPPSAFKGTPTSPFNMEPERQSHVDTLSLRKLFNRLRTARPVSVQSDSSTQLTTRDMEYDDMVHSTLPVFSPSLLNPPIVVQPVRPVLTFPRGITGRGYTPEHEQDPRFGTYSEDGTAPWPAATLPEMTPSPAPTDSSGGMINHLLHPRLAMGLPRSEQASVTSLRDNEDYSRPINGLVNNHLRSTTTLEIHDAGQSDHAEE